MSAVAEQGPADLACGECAQRFHSSGALRRHVALDHRPAFDGAEVTAALLAAARATGPDRPDADGALTSLSLRLVLVCCTSLTALLWAAGVPLTAVICVGLLLTGLMGSLVARSRAAVEGAGAARDPRRPPAPGR